MNNTKNVFFKKICNLFPTYTYSQMKKRIAMLEEKENEADYPDELYNKRVWSFPYLYKLYEWSVNGARSPRSIAHLKRVANTLYFVFACVLIFVMAAIALVFWKFQRD